MALEFDAPLLRWGNSYGLRITRKQAQMLGVRPGVPVHACIERAGAPAWDIPTLPPDHADGDWSKRHDEILAEAIEEEWRDWQAS